MPRGQFRTILTSRDVDGTAIIPASAVVRVLKPDLSGPITDTLYTTRTGGTTFDPSGETITGGEVEFYCDYHQVAQLGITVSPNPEEYRDIDIGKPYGDENVLTYGVRPENTGAENFDAFTEAFTGTMVAGSFRYIPPAVGGYQITASQPLLYPSTLDGWLISGPGPGGTNRLPPAYLKATGAIGVMPAMLAPFEWYTNGVTEDTGQGWCLKEFGLWGGGIGAGSKAAEDSAYKETQAKTNHGLVLHGSGFKVKDVMVVSCNGDGILIPGVGMDGTTVIGESHENYIGCSGVRYTGGHGIHAGDGQQDSTIEGFSKIQYAGGHCIYLEDGPGWSLVNNHPSWGAGDIIRIANSGWQARVALNYVGSVGKYLDGTGYAGGPVDEPNTHYGIYAKASPAVVALNQVNDNAQTAQSDAIGGYYIQGAGMYMKGNTFIFNAGDNGTLLNDQTSGDSIVGENIEMTS